MKSSYLKPMIDFGILKALLSPQGVPHFLENPNLEPKVAEQIFSSHLHNRPSLSNSPLNLHFAQQHILLQFIIILI